MPKQKLSDFRPQQQNANKHTPRGLGMLDDAIAKEGWITAITVTADGEAIDGSARLEAAAERFGVDVEPIVVESKGDRPIIHIRRDIPSADDPRARQLSIAANRIAEVDLEWDLEVLEDWGDDINLREFWGENELINLMSDSQPTEEELDEMGMGGDREAKEVECKCPSCGHEFVKQM